MKWFFHSRLYDDRCQRKQRFAGALFAAVMVCASSPLVAAGPPESKRVFVPNAALIYRGVYVDPQIVNGTSGYMIEIRDRSVTVNGITVFHAWDGPIQPSIVTHPEVPVENPLEETLRQFWNRSTFDRNRALITVDGRSYVMGDEFDFELHGTDVKAHIRLTNMAMWVRVGTDSVRAVTLERPAVIDRRKEDERVLRKALGIVRAQLAPGRVLVKGKHYDYSFDISELAAIRKSFEYARSSLSRRAPSQIPQRATFGGYSWDAAVLRDVLNADGKNR